MLIFLSKYLHHFNINFIYHKSYLFCSTVLATIVIGEQSSLKGHGKSARMYVCSPKKKKVLTTIYPFFSHRIGVISKK